MALFIACAYLICNLSPHMYSIFLHTKTCKEGKFLYICHVEKLADSSPHIPFMISVTNIRYVFTVWSPDFCSGSTVSFLCGATISPLSVRNILGRCIEGKLIELIAATIHVEFHQSIFVSDIF